MSTYYTKDHEWVRIEGDTALVGISEHAQQALGDVVFVELPPVGKEVSQGDQVAVVESVKAANELYAPLSGEVIEGNTELEENPTLVNEAAESKGWFFKLRLRDPEEVKGLMDADAYQAYLATLD